MCAAEEIGCDRRQGLGGGSIGEGEREDENVLQTREMTRRNV